MRADAASKPVVSTSRLSILLAALALSVTVFGLVTSGRPQRTAAAEPGQSVHPVVRFAPTTSDTRQTMPFFGFLEFDWDANAPDGVPGFDPWPQSASPMHAQAAPTLVASSTDSEQ